jgi:toxin ParE1/3/4
MAEYRLSKRAAMDLEAIADYTIDRFGIEQARRYRDGLRKCFRSLAKNPGLGRRAEQLARNLQQYEHQSHIVFYRQEKVGILIVRILHSRMDAPRHL